MTTEKIRQMSELDNAAHKADGYVVYKGVKHTMLGQKDFMRVRNYCVKNGINMSSLSAEQKDNILKMKIH